MTDTLPAVLDCPARHGGGTLRYHFADRTVTIEVAAGEWGSSVVARLHAAIGIEIQEATNGKDRTMTKFREGDVVWHIGSVCWKRAVDRAAAMMGIGWER